MTLTIIIKVGILAVLYGSANLLTNKDVLEAFNSALNFVSVYILIRASREYRNRVAPKTERIEAKVEDVFSAVLPQPWDGYERRKCDD